MITMVVKITKAMYIKVYGKEKGLLIWKMAQAVGKKRSKK